MKCCLMAADMKKHEENKKIQFNNQPLCLVCIQFYYDCELYRQHLN